MPIQHSFLPYLLVCCCAVLSCSREIPPEQKQADALLSKARDSFERKQYHEARQMLWSANQLDVQLARAPQLAEEYELLGNIYAAGASFDSAMLLYARAIEQYKGLADRNSATSLIIETSLLYRKMGNERKAHARLTEALRLARVFKDSTGTHKLLWALVPNARALDLQQEESAYLAELLNGALVRNDLVEQTRIHSETGISFLMHGNHGRAEESFLRALTFAEQSRDSLLAIDALYRLAMTHAYAGKIEQAFETYTEALRRTDITRNAQRLRQEMLMRVGNTYLKRSLSADAARFYRAALASAVQLGDKLSEGYCFIQLGHCEALGAGGMDAAAKSYTSALELFANVHYARGFAYALQSLGYNAQRMNKHAEALEYYKKAIEQAEQVHASQPFDELFSECEQAYAEADVDSPYDNMIELSLQLGRTEEAFWYLSRKNGAATARALSALEISGGDSSGLETYIHARGAHIGGERLLATLLAAGPREQAMYKDIVEEVERSSRSMDEASANVVQSNSALESVVRIVGYGSAEVRKMLAPGTALIAYASTRRTLYAFVVTPNRFSVQLAAVERTALAASAAEFASQLQQRVMLEDSVESQQRTLNRRINELTALLFSQLIRPIEQDIAGASRLLMLMPEELEHVPVHALRRAVSRSVASYVAERFIVRYLPSLSALALANIPLRAERQVIGLGHAGATAWDVEYELRDIRAFYKEARLFFGEQATLSALRDARADVAHLALQVLFSRNSPQNSSILFSDGNSGTTTKPVQWGELRRLPAFGAIVFSDLGGNATMHHATLAHTLLMTGTGGVLLNSFTPSRKSKKYFGEAFYTALLAGVDMETAVHQMQLAMIKSPEYSAPHTWAPFFLWGK